MNYTTIDYVNIWSKLKTPVLSSSLRLKSKMNSDLYSSFVLPVVGDYANNFTLVSNYILKGSKDTLISVDCLSNYIDNVVLCLNQRTDVLGLVDNLPRTEYLSTFTVNDKHVVKLEFLNAPLLTSCSTSDFIVSLKFKQPPPVTFTLTYDILFTNDVTYAETLSKECFTMTYLSQQSRGTTKQVNLLYDRGRASIY